METTKTKETRDVIVRFRLTEAEEEAVRQAMAKHNIRFSTLLNRALSHCLEVFSPR